MRRLGSAVRAYPAVLRWSLAAVVLTVGGCATFRVWVWTLNTDATIVIPKGYRGEILLAEEAGAAQPQRSWRTFTYMVPESGVLRVKRLDVLDTYSQSHRITCREADGTVVPAWRGGDGSAVSYRLHGSVRICRISVRKGRDHDKLLIPVDQWEEILAHGVPVDYVAPREPR